LLKKLINILIKLNRSSKKLIMISVDFIVILFTLLCSFSLRLGYWFWPKGEVFWMIIAAPVIAVLVFINFKLYQSVLRFIGSRDLKLIVQAVSLYAFAWGLLCYMYSIDGIPGIIGIPRSVILINWVLSIFILFSVRMLASWILSHNNSFSESKKNNILIYGAGSAGRQLSHSLQLSNKFKHIAYLDDNLEKVGSYINNVPVFSPDQIDSLIVKKNISEILLALPSVSRRKKNAIIDKLQILPVVVRSLPSLSLLTEGKVKIDDLLTININDLLGREPVTPNEKLLKIKTTNKVVLVTGAGGSIGSELCRQILFLKPEKLILFDISESSLYKIQQELINLNMSSIEISAVIGSVRDVQRMKTIIKYYGVQTLFHAAAYKHVPMVEHNQSQGVLNNSIGTMLAAEAAIAEKVETFVLISTDKAVRPTSTMGASKRVAELVLQALSKQNHQTCLTMVRFGNVLDSSGSVIPLFKKQIEEGGPITLTDINMVRYFMTIPEAVELVIQASAMASGGDVFVLDMGKPIKIYDLAVKMIHLSGLQLLNNNNPDGDIEIIYTGLRPGEKLYEELLVGNDPRKTQNKLILKANEEMIDWKILKPMMNKLNEASVNADVKRIRELLIQIVPEFKPQNTKVK
jgi:FlaA1/EpsC-like NDP-sugar epimerase